jgi:hypothetical protein
VPDERSGIERVLDFVNGIRGLIGALIFGGAGVAAVRSGGTAGWVVGVVLLAVAAVIVGLAIWSMASGLEFRPRE